VGIVSVGIRPKPFGRISMFLSAPAFNQNLAAWNLASVSSMLILHGEPERFFPFRTGFEAFQAFKTDLKFLKLTPEGRLGDPSQRRINAPDLLGIRLDTGGVIDCSKPWAKKKKANSCDRDRAQRPSS
jgi:hypothetical protein